jgi:O-antigen ligase
LSADARLLIWRVSSEIAIEKPITGHGINSFSSLYMPSQADYFKKHPDSIFKDVSNNNF